MFLSPCYANFPSFLRWKAESDLDTAFSILIHFRLLQGHTKIFEIFVISWNSFIIMILVCSFIKLGENCFHPWGLNHVQPFYRNCFNFQYKMYLFERLFPTTENIRIFNFLVFIRARIYICKTLSALPLELRWIFPLQDRVKFTAALSLCKQSLPSLLKFWGSVIKQ